MSMLLALISVAIISAIALVARRFSRLKSCPICAGVGLTWFFLLLARGGGYPVDPLVLGLLLGGSVVGIESLLAKRLAQPKPGGKILLIVAGLWSAYNLIMSDWLMLVVGLSVWIIVFICFYQKTSNFSPNSEKKEEVKKQLENCC